MKVIIAWSLLTLLIVSFLTGFILMFGVLNTFYFLIAVISLTLCLIWAVNTIINNTK